VETLCQDQAASVRESAAALLQHVLTATNACTDTQRSIVTSLGTGGV
jgi:hypothetical protein